LDGTLTVTYKCPDVEEKSFNVKFTYDPTKEPPGFVRARAFKTWVAGAAMGLAGESVVEPLLSGRTMTVPRCGVQPSCSRKTGRLSAPATAGPPAVAGGWWRAAPVHPSASMPSGATLNAVARGIADTVSASCGEPRRPTGS
jgi:hypothetical protein